MRRDRRFQCAAMWRDEFTALIKDQFRQMQEKNPRFSMRAYAQRLNLSSGTLTELMHGRKRWNLSVERAAEILDLLRLSESADNRYRALLGLPLRRERKEIGTDRYPAMTDWTYVPILISCDLPPPKCEPAQIARRLGVSEEKVLSVIDELLSLKMLVRGEDGRPRLAEPHGGTTDNIPNEIYRRNHELNFELNRRALDLPAEKRDFTAMTFTGSSAALAAMRAEIRRLFEKAAIMDIEGANDNVFRLSVQLFPLDFTEISK